jgi:non-ribosomal peptide synthetase component E (peptide arylation enzyme)
MRHKTTDEAIHSGWINITDVSAIRKYLTSMARPYHCQPIFNGDRFAIIFADHRMYTPDSVRVGTANMSQIQWNKLNDLNDRVSASTGALSTMSLDTVVISIGYWRSEETTLCFSHFSTTCRFRR